MIDVEALLDAASGHVAVGESQEAVVLYRQCVAAEPQNFDAWRIRWAWR